MQLFSDETSPRYTYFVSDFHLGANGRLDSRAREQQILRWLDEVASHAEAIYLVGDVFDFWFEYKTVIPKGFTRILGKLATLRDAGLPIFFFTGNHDLWVFDFFEKEFGIPTYREPIVKTIGGKNFYIGHGDGLGDGDYGYKFLKKVFTNPVCQWLFARLHPNFGIGLAHRSSRKSRAAQPDEANQFLGENNEWLLGYANKLSQTTHQNIDYFVFGHRHLPIDWTLKNAAARYVNLGEWLNFCSYAVFDGNNLQIKFFESEKMQRFDDEFKIYTNRI